MTPQQVRVVTAIQQYPLKNNRGYELKRFAVEELPAYGRRKPTVLVSVTAGMKNETVAAQAFCREYGCFSVGPRGKITPGYSAVKKWGATKANRYPLIYGWW